MTLTDPQLSGLRTLWEETKEFWFWLLTLRAVVALIPGVDKNDQH
jgi:hypothetical protein